MKYGLISLALLTVLIACNKEEQISSGVSLHAELGGSAAGFQRACNARQFNFPKDHGAHSSFRNEWWYITGNLENEAGRKYGFHITFFRIANQPLTEITGTGNQSGNQNSNWSSNEFYMAHFAVTAEDEKIKTYERFSRAAAGLAGANPDHDNTIRVWLDDWQLLAKQQNDQLVWQLKIKEADIQLDLNLTAEKPLVLQGDAGYSQKSADPCNASYYYSYTRLKADGTLQIDNDTHKVDGSAWLDREWSSSALGANQSGWDWFAIQLNDGRDIMLYQLRKRDGSRDDYSHAVEIDSDGNPREISIDNIELEITRWWQSEFGSRYPVAGIIRRKDTNETLVFEPLVDDQLLDLTVRYWEGAISLSNKNNESIGRGYMELTGY